MRRLIVALALGLAGPAAADTLVVGNKGEDSVSLIALSDGAERARLKTGPQPHEVAVSPDGRRAAVVAYGGSTIDLIDIPAAKTLQRIELAPNRRPHGIVWLPDGRIVATTEGNSTLSIVDAATGKLTGAIPTGQAGSHMVAVDRAGRRAYVTNLGARSVSVIDLGDRSKVADLKAGEQPEGVALSKDGRELWVANRAGDSVMVFDTASLKPLATIAVGRVPIRLAISPDGATAVTSNYGAGDLTLIDVEARKVRGTLPVSGSTEAAQVTIAFSPDGKRLYVAETAMARVAEVDLATGKVVRRLAAGKGSDGLGISAVDVTAPR